MLKQFVFNSVLLHNYVFLFVSFYVNIITHRGDILFNIYRPHFHEDKKIISVIINMNAFNCEI